MKTVSTVVMVLQALVVGFIAWRVLGPPTAPLQQPGAYPEMIRGAALQQLGFPDPSATPVEILSAGRDCGVVSVATGVRSTTEFVVRRQNLAWSLEVISKEETADACG